MKLLVLLLAVVFNISSALAECRVRVLYELENHDESTLDAFAFGLDKASYELSEKIVGVSLGMNGFYRSSKNVVATAKLVETKYKYVSGKHEVSSVISLELKNNPTLITLPVMKVTSQQSHEDAIQVTIEKSIKNLKLEKRLAPYNCK